MTGAARVAAQAAWIALRSVVLVIGIGILLLYLLQDRFVYYPTRYARPDPETHSQRTLTRVQYRLPAGAQTAFYAAPESGGVPKRLWLMVSGNGGTVLFLVHLAEQPALAEDGVLLVDHPGYGFNAGKPSGAAMQQGADAALAALAAELKVPEETLLARTGIVGHSLGTGIATEFAVAHPEVRRVVLLAPFTSLYDMAYNAVGPAAHLLHHNYDNATNVKLLATRDPRPAVVIVHGTADTEVPVTMSRRLQREDPWVTYMELPGYTHNDVISGQVGRIASIMAAMP